MPESLACRSFLVLIVFSTFSLRLSAADATSMRLPDEIEAVGGQGTALGHAGAAALNDLAALRLNPAMLSTNRSYDVEGAYYWPSAGRPFYKLGIIDGVTSQFVMGFEYTGFQDQLKPQAERTELDSPVYRRMSLALAVPAQGFALGFAGHYVEAQNPDLESLTNSTLKGISLGAGLVVPLGKSLRAGVSLENFNNKRIAAVAPRTVRAGLNWEDSSQVFALNLDYRERQRSLSLELPIELAQTQLAENVKDELDKPERMGLVGMQVRTFNVLRFFASYGQTTDGPERTTTSGGLGIFQRNYSLAYAVSKSLPAQSELQSSLHLSVIMKM